MSYVVSISHSGGQGVDDIPMPANQEAKKHDTDATIVQAHLPSPCAPRRHSFR